MNTGLLVSVWAIALAVGFTDRANAVSAYTAIQAESFNASSGICTYSDGFGCAAQGNYVAYNAVDFGTNGANAIEIRLGVPKNAAGMPIEVRLDSTTGPLIGKLTTVSTGGATAYTIQKTSVANALGVRTVYLVFPGSKETGRVDWFRFVEVTPPPPPPPPTPAPTQPPAPLPSPSAQCPSGAIPVTVGASIQNAVNAAGTDATFCIKSGVHRMQTISPKAGQKFYGEPGTILSGARLVTSFTRDGSYWVASGQTQQGIVRGDCILAGCDLPEGLFINDAPLTQVTSKSAVTAGKFYFDYSRDRIYFLDDPTGKKVEATATNFAFTPSAGNVLISGLIIEKYSNPAQEGAIQGEEASGWSVENSEIRYNSGTGVSVGTNGRMVGNKIHHNGQMGATAGGNNILVENNEIGYNNIYGFASGWEAGGIKITESNGVTYRGNYVHHNDGPGLWSDENVYNTLYENNYCEYNAGAGVFHEISYNAIVRNNTLRYNGWGFKGGWFWDTQILIAASQDVEVMGNNVTAQNGATSIILIDQNRGPNAFGTLYKTQNNYVHHNILTYEGESTAGGASDAELKDPNYSIIENGNNRFDYNTYRVKSSSLATYVWGHTEYNFLGFRSKGQELNGSEILY